MNLSFNADEWAKIGYSAEAKTLSSIPSASCGGERVKSYSKKAN